MLQSCEKSFSFEAGEVVLAKYSKEIFYAKILSIEPDRKSAMLLFDDNSQDTVEFHNIFSVNETTADIICVVCRGDGTDTDNDIVLCDICSVGYHQKCHVPNISSEILLPEVPWQCYFCESSKNNPYVQENPFGESRNNSAVGFYSSPSKLVKDPEDPKLDGDVSCIQDTESKESENMEQNEKSRKTSINHADSSPFHFITKMNEEANELKRKQDDTCDEVCSHHDMSNNNILSRLNKDVRKSGIIHCEHSDIFKRLLTKTIKVNRVSPWVNEESDNLIVDEVADEKKTNADDDVKITNSEKDVCERKEKNKNKVNGRIENISKERFLQDLPRYNWLVERLKNENKLGEDDIRNITESVTKEKKLNLPTVLKEKPKKVDDELANTNDEKCDQIFQNVEDGNDHQVNGIKIVKVESLSKLNVETTNYDRDDKLPSKVMEETHQPSRISQEIRETFESFDQPSRISQEIRETFESFAAHSKKTSINKMIDEIKTSKMAAALKPKIISECPSKQYSIPSTKDLEAIRYDALSVFNKKEIDAKVKARTENTKLNAANDISKQNHTSTNRVFSNRNGDSSMITQNKLSKLNNFEQMSMNGSNSAMLKLQKNISTILGTGTQMGFRSNIQYTMPNNVPFNLQSNQNFYQNQQNTYPTVLQVPLPLRVNSLVSPLQNTNVMLPSQMRQMISNSSSHQLYTPITNQINGKIKTFSMVNQPSQQEMRRRMQIQRQLQIQRKWIEEHDVNRQLQSVANKTKEKQIVSPPDESSIDERIEILSREIKELQKKKDLISPTKKDLLSPTKKQVFAKPQKHVFFPGSDYSPVEKICSPQRYHDTSPGKDGNFLLRQLQNKYDEANEEEFRLSYEIRSPIETQQRIITSPTNQVSRNNHMRKTYGRYNGRDHDRSLYSPEAVVRNKGIVSPDANLYKRKSPEDYCLSPNKYRRQRSPTHIEPRSEYRPHNEYSRGLTNQNFSHEACHIKSKSKLHKPCKKCGQVASFLCSECRVVWYCSQTCQLSDWKIHRKNCLA